MTDELPVHISRDELHAVEVPASFETDGTFDVRLVNHGSSLHVHLHLDDALSEVATLEANNHYVEGDSTRVVRVDVETDRLDGEGGELFGKLKVVSAYGAQTRWIDIEVTQPEDGDGGIEIDESLGDPQPKPEPEEPSLADRPELVVAALALVALAIAIVIALVLRSLLVLAGALVVLAGVVVALFLLLE